MFLSNTSPERAQALRQAAAALEREFDGVFTPVRVEEFLASSYEQIAATATITSFLPLLAERFARQRLRALAKLEHRVTDPRPAVLFLCTHNAGRSQMAMGWFSAVTDDRAVCWSGGTEPSGQLNPYAVAAMAEVGIDISGEYAKPWTPEVAQAADVIVSLGCGDACPVYPGVRIEDWTLEPSSVGSLEDARLLRDELAKRVRHLADSLGLSA